jgi:hypothetical protein
MPNSQHRAPDTALDRPPDTAAGNVRSIGDHRTVRVLRKDWFEYLGLDGYCCSFVRGLGERELLLRLGVEPTAIRTVPHYLDVLIAAERDSSCAQVVVVDVGGWTLLVERDTAMGFERAVAVSAGTEMVVAHMSTGARRSFRYLRNGVVLTAFEDGDLGHLVGWGAEPEKLAPLVDQIGAGRFYDFDEDGITPDLELACLVAGVRPRQQDFQSPLLAADVKNIGSSSFVNEWTHQSTA